MVVDLGHSGSFGSEITKSNHRRMEERANQKKVKRLCTWKLKQKGEKCKRTEWLGQENDFPTQNWENPFKFESLLKRPIHWVKSEQEDE